MHWGLRVVNRATPREMQFNMRTSGSTVPCISMSLVYYCILDICPYVEKEGNEPIQWHVIILGCKGEKDVRK